MMNGNNIKKILGSNIKNLRLAKNLTKKQLEEQIGIDYISYIEVCKAFLTSDELAKLCNYFNVAPEYFFKNW